MGEFRMPSLGADMDVGTVSEWRVAPGDTVHRGDIVAVVETEKSTIEVEVFEDGVVEELLVAPGVEVEVGTPLARIGPTNGATPAPVPPSAPVAAPPSAPVEPGSGGHAVTSPLVRRLAERTHVDLSQVKGTGPGGGVTRADVEAAQAEAATTADRLRPQRPDERVAASPYARRRAEQEDIDLAVVTGSGPGGAVVARDLPESRPVAPPPSSQAQTRRRSIGALMARAKREIPHYYVSSTIDLGAASEWCERVNATRPVADRVLIAAVLLRATVRAALDVPALNGHFVDGALVSSPTVDLGVAISLRAGGLVAPAISDAEKLGVDELMARLRDLVKRARAGVLRGSDMVTPSITVTNLGDQGADSVLPIIYPPQVAMIGFGRVVERPWAAEGMLTVRPVVNATVAADHRASDGHDGARFLGSLDRWLQRPEEL